MRYGFINHNVLDTTPGCGGPFAPPADFSDLQLSYRQFMIDALRDDFGVRQHVAVVARRLKTQEPPTFIGPYAADAQKVALAVLRRLALPTRKETDE